MNDKGKGYLTYRGFRIDIAEDHTYRIYELSDEVAEIVGADVPIIATTIQLAIDAIDVIIEELDKAKYCDMRRY